MKVDDFEILGFLGEGAYGKVFKVCLKEETSQVYAMKVLNKKTVLKKQDSHYIREERRILSEMDHPFIISLEYAFQTDTKLYLIMALASGGHLFKFLAQEGFFPESCASFYLSEMILAIEYLHKKGVIHRDLKAENVLLDGSGHVKLTDFGLAKYCSRTRTRCGTEMFWAPEMISTNDGSYTKAVDFWSLGCLFFEMTTGSLPFYDDDVVKLQKQILSRSPKFPRHLSDECVALLKGLLHRNSTLRLGNTVSSMFKVGGVEELKQHEFFSKNNVDFKEILAQKVTPPLTLHSTNAAIISSAANRRDREKKEKKALNLIQQERMKSRTTSEFAHENFQNFSFGAKTFAQIVVQNDSDDASDSECFQEEFVLNEPSKEAPKSVEDLVQERLEAFSFNFKASSPR